MATHKVVTTHKAKPKAPAPAPLPAPKQALAAGSGTATLPAGGRLLIVNGVYVIQYEMANGLKIYYDFSAPGALQQFSFANLGQAQTIDPNQFYAQSGLVHGGLAQELSGIKAPTFQDWFNNQFKIATGNATWANDPEMAQIYANWIVNPEISQEEIQADIKGTNWWKTQTAAQQTYNNSSPADQAKQDQQAAASLAQQYFSVVGQQISMADPQLQQWAHQVASGASSEGAIIENYLKPLALKDPNSPWSRTLLTEQEAQRQQAVDVSNQTQQVQDLYKKWGVALSADGAKDIANKVVTKQMSDADLLDQVKSQANVLYPWKPPDMDTTTAAAPWLQTYANVLERPAPELNDPLVAKALNSGTPVYQFEQDLKATPQWLQTKNAQDSLSTAAAQVGKIMGFV